MVVCGPIDSLREGFGSPPIGVFDRGHVVFEPGTFVRERNLALEWSRELLEVGLV